MDTQSTDIPAAGGSSAWRRKEASTQHRDEHIIKLAALLDGGGITVSTTNTSAEALRAFQFRCLNSDIKQRLNGVLSALVTTCNDRFEYRHGNVAHKDERRAHITSAGNIVWASFPNTLEKQNPITSLLLERVEATKLDVPPRP